MSRCRYCGRDIVQLARHEAAWPRNPEVAERVRVFMVEWAEDGRGLSSTAYSDLKSEEEPPLPHVRSINRLFPTWGAFVEWCGLRWEPYINGQGGPREFPEPTTMPGSVMADDTEHHDPSCLRCEPVIRPVRAWQPHAHAWAVVGAQTAWQVR